jgi:hypothetical protein
MPRQYELFESSVPGPSGIVTVNDRVSFRTEGPHRVVSVHGIVAAHYDLSDRAAEAFAMVNLFEAGYADQNEIARAFGYSSRSLRRYQERLSIGGVHSLGRARGRPSLVTASRPSPRDRTILQLKARGLSNRTIAQRLGVVENTIRKRLRRLHWSAPPVDTRSFLDQPDNRPMDTAQPALPVTEAPRTPPTARLEADRPTLDADPADRSMDRLLAAMGRLDDARPLFAAADHLPGAGVLLAVPALVASGVLSTAQRIYGSLAPAFYGLRTTVLAYIVLALLRIARPEMLKEHAPGQLGQIVGLDRMPEVKTLRRKLAQLAGKGRAQEFGREMARLRIRERGRMLGFLYVDGHVRAYHGTRRIAKAYLTCARITGPATTDYWINDKRGEPLFVVTADANAKMTRMLVPILEELRPLLARKRRLTVVFDRAGWSPKLFHQIVGMGFDVLTYRKGRVRQVAPRRFVERRARLDGRRVKYMLHDQAVRFLKGKLRLRQVTRLTPATGHQTPIVTSRWDLPDIVIAYRMFERWRQENFFKYMRQEYLIDALTDYAVEPDDPERSVPNPARKAVDKELRQARREMARLRESYGTAALDYVDGRTPTMEAFTEAEQRLQGELRKVQARIARLVERQKTLPVRTPLSETPHGAEAVRLSTERKHLTNVLKMVAYQIESTLVEQLRPYYARTDDEGRTLIQTALRACAAIEPTVDELRVTLAPLSSPHRSAAIRRLCEDLNKTRTLFPGSNLRLCFAVAQSAP